ncbi:MAG: Gfo/Idh/MocA family oxidoreductase [Ignavibacteriaceae bacterium]
MNSVFNRDIKISSPLRIGIIGCGRAAERIYLPSLKNVNNIKITAAVDPVEDRRNLISGNFSGCTAYKSIDENLFNSVDAAIITTPPDSHIRLASEFLKRNKYVLVEKPLSLSLEGTQELKEIESSSKAGLMMGFNHRYWLPVVKMKEKLSLKEKINFSEIIFTSNYSKWNPVSFISSPLDDLGPHLFDLITYIFDKRIVSVTANQPVENEINLKVKTDGNESIVCRIAFEDETIRTIKINREEKIFFIFFKSVRILPGKGFFRDFLDIKDRLTTKLLRKEFPFNISYKVQLEKFFNFVKSGAIPIPGIDEGISSILAIESARSSIINNGKEIYLDEFNS